ncbi:MAG: MGH1-like glycoside hydrolase domain-containing protein, partial [Steroidobacteraceae bacterium]
GNHGEDVKELYYYLDALPTHSYCKALYQYPQLEFPYLRLIEENARRSRLEPEFELLDTGLFDDGRYFDVFVEYAKAAPDDLLIRLTVVNRAGAAAEIHLLPTLWYRNTWSWGPIEAEAPGRPKISRAANDLIAEHETLGSYRLRADASRGAPILMFTENETNSERLFGVTNRQPYVKDAFHEAVIHGNTDCINPAQTGTKAALHYRLTVPPGGTLSVKLRLSADSGGLGGVADDFERIFQQRIAEADLFYSTRIDVDADTEKRHIARSAYAGLLWSKQFYNLVQHRWLTGDPAQIAPPPGHRARNADWQHLYARDVLSMPDKWEFPYFCSWDAAFQCVSLSQLDQGLAKYQLLLLLREWYMHRNGELPAYEFSFSDVNPPVHPWAVWRVYRLPAPGQEPDRAFLERCFQKLLLNFTWWVNREDHIGNNLFGGGFLGLDNIGVFDRSKPLPMGGDLEQVDGTSWMAFYCIHMLSMALELAREDSVYEDIASKFLEHFGAITHAINQVGGCGLWDPEDGFYYDCLRLEGRRAPLRIHSIVGFIPMFATTLIRRESVQQFTGFLRRAEWEAKYRSAMAQHVITLDDGSPEYLLTIPTRRQLERMLRRLFDESEFLAPFGIRSLSKAHQAHPYVYSGNGRSYSVDYEPGESTSDIFGGNSNWRGPIWFPLNYLILESLRVYHRFYGDRLLVEFPTGSGQCVTLGEAAHRLSHRLQKLFLPDANGRRPCHGNETRYAEDPNWKSLLLFNEYYHADTGRGCGASHQTGWTALIADLLNLESHWTVAPRANPAERTPSITAPDSRQ